MDSGSELDDWQVEAAFASCHRMHDGPLVATGEPDALQPQELLERGAASCTVSLRLSSPAVG